MTEQWQELKETITELRDNDGTGTQQEICKFLVNYMDILEEQMRRPTPEERESIEKYVKSISKPTGVNFWDLVQEPCEDAISRQAANILVDELARAISDERCYISRGRSTASIMQDILDLPPVKPQEKTGHCKDCKYFEYDSVAKVDGIPLIVAHEICSKWGDGCKTKEDGYCFLFEPQESEG